MTDDSKVRAISSWATLVGRWTIPDDGSATYLGKQADEREYGTVLSNVRFPGGTIRALFRQQSGLVDGRILLGAKSDFEVIFCNWLGRIWQRLHTHSFRWTCNWLEKVSWHRPQSEPR